MVRAVLRRAFSLGFSLAVVGGRLGARIGWRPFGVLAVIWPDGQAIYWGMMMREASVNVLGGDLAPCSTRPVTGFYRNGCCDTGPEDRGMHTVCAVMTAEFLALSKYLGNDLSTPRPECGFAGLNPGDRWCLCASRFLQAHDEGAAPLVHLAATHKATLGIVPLEVLQRYAAD